MMKVRGAAARAPMIAAAAAAACVSLSASLFAQTRTQSPAQAQSPPLVNELAWAYAITPGPAPAAPVDDGTKHTLPGSDQSFTLDQIRNRMGPADWYPGDHPSMPPIVAVGREAAGIWACGLCHYPNGQGRPENAGVAGLNKEYFIQQLYDFKRGRRHSAEPLKANTELMVGFAVAMTDEEIEQSAEYFASLEWRPWIEVVEASTVPKTRPAGGMWLRLEVAEAGMEPIGRRIIETPSACEIHGRASRPMCRRDRSRKGRRSRAAARRPHAPCVMATTSRALRSCPRFADARRATSRASSPTSSKERGTDSGRR
jgi:cytochrome c553